MADTLESELGIFANNYFLTCSQWAWVCQRGH